MHQAHAYARCAALIFLLGAAAGCPKSEEAVKTSGQAASVADDAMIVDAILEIDALKAQGKGREAALKHPEPKEKSADYTQVKRLLSAWSLPSEDKAWKRFKRLTDEDPTFYWGFLGQARVYTTWKIDDQAFGNLEKAEKYKTGLLTAQIIRAKLHRRRGDYDKALAAADSVVKERPQRPEGHRLRGDILSDQEKFQPALEAYEVALERGLESVEVRLNVAKAWKKLDNKPKAITAYQRVVDAKPKDGDSWLELAKLLDAEKRGPEAAKAYRSYLELVGDDLDVLLAVARIEFEGGNEDAALDAFRRAVKLDPEKLEAQQAIARINLKRDRLEAAEDAFLKVLEIQEKNIEALLALARIFSKSDRFREAIEYYQRVLTTQAEPPMEEGERETVMGELKTLEKSVHLGQKPVEGKDPNQVYYRVRWRIQQIYKKLLEENKRLRGRIVAEVHTEKTGVVSKVNLIEDTLHQPVLEAYAYWTLRAAKFPRDIGRRKYTLAFELDPEAK